MEIHAAVSGSHLVVLPRDHLTHETDRLELLMGIGSLLGCNLEAQRGKLPADDLYRGRCACPVAVVHEEPGDLLDRDVKLSLKDVGITAKAVEVLGCELVFSGRIRGAMVLHLDEDLMAVGRDEPEIWRA